MTPNNNLSILPFYKTIGEQNARKWWVYGRVYPLFTPIGTLPPFQIMRPKRTIDARGEFIGNDDNDNGYLAIVDNEVVWKDDNTYPCFVSVYENIQDYNKLWFENLPYGYNLDAPMIIFADADNKVISTYDIYALGVLFTGVIDVPNGAEKMYIQSYNEEAYEENATVYTVNEVARSVYIRIYNADGTLFSWGNTSLSLKGFGDNEVIVYTGSNVTPVTGDWAIGQYYIEVFDGVDTWYSDVFTVVQDMSGYLKLEWWDMADFVMDAGTIVYTEPAYKNILYLCSDIAKPEYIFNEEIIERDGYTFPVKQVSEKKYRFSFLAPEYLLDVIRFIRMSDFVRITKNGQTYNKIDSFLITPEWESNGDIAVVDAEFTTDTVAKKNGHGYIPN